ncbi:MAG: hypothetical protein HZC52_08170 [Planctomycetes bacterium]|nr:hypothetical protein [Planctomycetota bacterium]
MNWSATVHVRLLKTSGVCINALMILTHQCDVTARIDANTVDMIDRKLSCNVDNYPVQGNCSHTAIIRCGPGLENNTYRVTYNPASNTLSCVMTAGQGGEYTGTFNFVKAITAQHSYVINSLSVKDIEELGRTGVA